MSQSSNNLIRHHTAKFSVKTQCNSALEFPPEERETNKKESTNIRAVNPFWVHRSLFSKN
jgi:hypothetical protein